MYKSAQNFLPRSKAPEVLVFRSPLRGAVKKLSPHAKSIVLARPTAGQADTTSKALAAVGPKESVLISACDHGLLWNHDAWKSLLQQKPDVIVFGQRGYPGARRAPTHFSYIDADEAGRIRRVSVKKSFTKEPQKELVLVGTFYAAEAGVLKKAIDLLIKRNIRVNGERYLDSVVSLLIEQGLDVRCFETEGFLNWGSPDALAEFSYWHHYFQGVPA
jgi:bifunctional N-acetylglucosamine-1-phosphate-uridyltransferase/glucosamine-1-phosphate-acetyltransferase GlmU-like protein